jgi:hypothetical protein
LLEVSCVIVCSKVCRRIDIANRHRRHWNLCNVEEHSCTMHSTLFALPDGLKGLETFFF